MAVRPGAGGYGSHDIALRPNADAASTTHQRLGAALNELRERLRLSQGDLAELSGVGQPDISRLERGTPGRLSGYARLFAAMGAELEFTTRLVKPLEQLVQDALGAARARRVRKAGERRRRRLARRSRAGSPGRTTAGR